MRRHIQITAAILVAATIPTSSETRANDVPSTADKLNYHSAAAVIARSTQPEIFRRIVYKSTGRKILPPPPPAPMRQFTLPSESVAPENDPFDRAILPEIPEPTISRSPSGLSDAILERISQYESLIKAYSRMNDLEPNLVKAVIYVESAGDQNAVSHKGAEGLMQLMPGTASDVGVSNSLDPAQNIYGGTRYLSNLVKRFKRVDLALWGYNAGPESVKRNRLPLETKLYIPNVLRIKTILDETGA